MIKFHTIVRKCIKQTLKSSLGIKEVINEIFRLINTNDVLIFGAIDSSAGRAPAWHEAKKSIDMI